MPASLQMIADAVDAFLMFIDGETLSVKERLNRLPHCLDQLALVLSDIPSTWDERDYPDPLRKEYRTLRETVSARFPNLGYYNIPSSISERFGEAEIEVG